MHYTNHTTPQLQLHYIATTAALHHTQSSSCGWGDHCNHCNHSNKHKSNHLSVNQWIRSAIRDSQRPTSPIGYLLWNFRHRLVGFSIVNHPFGGTTMYGNLHITAFEARRRHYRNQVSYFGTPVSHPLMRPSQARGDACLQWVIVVFLRIVLSQNRLLEIFLVLFWHDDHKLFNLVYPPICGTSTYDLMKNMMMNPWDFTGIWGGPSSQFATKDIAPERPSGPTGTKTLDVNWRLWRVLVALWWSWCM